MHRRHDVLLREAGSRGDAPFAPSAEVTVPPSGSVRPGFFGIVEALAAIDQDAGSTVSF